MQALRSRADIAWNRVSLFHMDEYLGPSDHHLASFRRYLSQQLVDIVYPRAFYGIAGDAPDVAPSPHPTTHNMDATTTRRMTFLIRPRGEQPPCPAANRVFRA